MKGLMPTNDVAAGRHQVRSEKAVLYAMQDACRVSMNSSMRAIWLTPTAAEMLKFVPVR